MDPCNNTMNNSYPDPYALDVICVNWTQIKAGGRTFISSTFLPIICGGGIMGILLTMVVLSRKTMSTSTNSYLTALAVADLGFLLILTVRIIIDRFDSCTFDMHPMFLVYDEYTIIVMDTFQYLTVGVTVMLAVERYIAICHPMKAMTVCTVKRARVIIVLLTILAFILRSPKLFDISIDTYPTCDGMRTDVTTDGTAYDNVLYTYIVTVLLLTLAPLAALISLNILLILEIRRSSRYLQYHLGMDVRGRSVVSGEELKITMMLVSVIFAFFACHAPYLVYTMITAVQHFDSSSMEALLPLNHVCKSLLALKASCNFILYCWFSEKFWMTFKRIFCLRMCMPKKINTKRNGINNNSHMNSHNNIHRPSCYQTKETTC